MRKGKINNASNSIAVAGDDGCNNDNIDANSGKGAKKCTFRGSRTNKVAKNLGTFRNNS